MIRFSCKKCGQKIRTSDKSGGKRGKCPKCKSPVIIPKTGDKPAQKSKYSFEGKSNAEIAKELLHSKASGDFETIPGKRKRNFLVPHYDEVTLFVMSIMFVLLYMTSKTMRTDLYELIFRDREISLIAAFIFFAAGILFSVFHAFSTREKNIGEKAAMLLFAVLVSAGTGIYAGMHMLKSSGGWLIIFPVWNIINGILLLAMFRFGSITIDCISDRDATCVQLALGLIAAIIIFICCQYFLKLHWAITYSICICYTVSLDKAVQSVFGTRAPVESYG